MGEPDRIFAQRLREFRGRRGLSQDALARRAGLVGGGKSVGQIERGERGTSLDVASRLARALGLPLGILMGEPEHPSVDVLLNPSTTTRDKPNRATDALQRVVALLRDWRDEDLASLEKLLEAWITDRPKPATRPNRRKR